MSLTIFKQTPELVLAHRGGLAIALLRGALDVAALRELDALHEHVLKTEPGVSTMLIRRGGVRQQMDATTREQAKRFIDRHRQHLRAFAYVYPDGGVKAAMIRKLVAGGLALSSTPAKVFRSEDEAAAWIVAQPGQPSELRAAGPDLAAALRELA